MPYGKVFIVKKIRKLQFYQFQKTPDFYHRFSKDTEKPTIAVSDNRNSFFVVFDHSSILIFTVLASKSRVSKNYVPPANCCSSSISKTVHRPRNWIFEFDYQIHVHWLTFVLHQEYIMPFGQMALLKLETETIAHACEGSYMMFRKKAVYKCIPLFTDLNIHLFHKKN